VLALVLANVRTPSERLGDLRAQRAACAAGRDAWQSMVARHGDAWCQAATDALLDYTERRARAHLASLEGVTGHCADVLEGDGVSDGPIAVVANVRVHESTLHIDLTGSSGAVRGNVNAPIAVARAASLFALRVLLDRDDIPVNEGLSRAIALRVPDDCVANAKRPSAVAAGNVELSQRLTDVILQALGDGLSAAHRDAAALPAQGQGTMNNITIGAPGWTFYETLGGGQGASARAHGPSAVHVGMSNTRNTPVESLEWAYPLRVRAYALRRGSGGAGARRGGDGVVRQYEPLVPVVLTLLTERRAVAPRGVHGGEAGHCGINRRGDESLPAKGRWQVPAAARITIETPGGGGHGTPAQGQSMSPGVAHYESSRPRQASSSVRLARHDSSDDSKSSASGGPWRASHAAADRSTRSSSDGSWTVRARHRDSARHASSVKIVSPSIGSGCRMPGSVMSSATRSARPNIGARERKNRSILMDNLSSC
jgi:N-methylhydantoinase B